ncbi:MAG: beta strand repeat-containing protein [Alphaproteobacteria bacterium]
MSTATQPIEITDEGPYPPEDPSDEPGSTVQPVLVHETDLEMGPTGESRALTIDFGPDGPADTGPVVLEIPAGLPAMGLTSGGTPLSYGVSPDGLTLSATAGGNPVFEVTLDDGGVGAWSYTFTLLDQVDHAPGLGENLITGIPFLVRITDGDGSSATAGFTAGIQDDLPELTPGATATVDEEDIAGGGNTSVTGFAATPVGVVDAPLTFSFNGNAPAGLTSQGDAITYAVSGTSLAALAAGRTVFWVSLNPASGSYVFTLNDQLDHPTGAGENLLSLAFGVNAIDFDGDVATAAISVEVVDDVPVALDGDTTVVNEVFLESATATSVTGFAADVLDSADDDVTGFFTPGQSAPLGLTSQGDAVSYLVSASSIIAVAGGRTVFTVALDSNTGTYTFVLRDQLDHPAGGNQNLLSLAFGVTAVDFDGDAATASFGVQVVDDIPTTIAVDHVTVHEFGLEGVTATSVTGASVLGGVVDQPASFAFTTGQTAPVGLLSEGQQLTYSISGTSMSATAGGRTVFTVSLNAATGNYTFTLRDQLDHTGPNGDALTVTFGVSAFDYDGDPINVTALVDVTDDLPSIAAGAATSVSETTLETVPTGATVIGVAATASGVVDNPGTFAFTTGQTAPVGLLSEGQQLTYNVSGTSMSATAGGRTVFTVSLNPTTGSYTFTLKDNLDHTGGNLTTHSLGFGVRVTDFDGDTASTTFQVNVTDDTPSIAAGATTSVNEQALVGTTGTAIVGVAGVATGVIDNPATYGFGTSVSAPGGLTSEGATVSYTLVGPNFLRATAGGRTVFTVSMNATTGSYTFTLKDNLDHPAGLGNNIHSLGFQVRVTDFDGDMQSTTFQVNVVDDVPVAVNDSTEGVAAGGNTIGTGVSSANLLVNDALGADGASLVSFRYVNESDVSVTAAAGSTVDTKHGTLTVNANGTWTYTSDATTGVGGAAPDNFTYTLLDGDGDQSTAVKPINVTALLAPIANDDFYATYEDIPGGLVVNAFNGVIQGGGGSGQDSDTDTPLANLQVVVGSSQTVGSQGGTIVWNANGSFTYTPPAQFPTSTHLQDTFTYTLTDGTQTDTATVTINVEARADMPILSGAGAGNEDTAIPLNIIATLGVDNFDGSEVLSNVTLSGVPSGATLNHGTPMGGGVWVLTQADLAGLTITPPFDSDVDMNLTISVTTTELSNPPAPHNTATLVVPFVVPVHAVADQPTVTVGATIPLEVSVDDSVPVAAIEGDGTTVTFTVTLTRAAAQSVVVDYQTVGGFGITGATAGSDFVHQIGSLTFAPGQTERTVTITLLDDAGIELPETFDLQLTAAHLDPSGANTPVTIADGTGVGTIIDDDAYTVMVSDGVPNPQLEGVPAVITFDVTLVGGPLAVPVEVSYTTIDASAIAGTHYQAISGVLTFAPGQTVRQVTVNVVDDSVHELDRSFRLNVFDALASPGGIDEVELDVSVGTGWGNIAEDDPDPFTGTFFVVKEDSSIALDISAVFGDFLDGSETHTVTLGPIPDTWTVLPGAGTLTHNALAGTYTWSVTVSGSGFAGGPTLIPPANSDVDIQGLTITAKAVEAENGNTATDVKIVDIVVDAVADEPTLTALVTLPSDPEGSVSAASGFQGVPSVAGLTANSEYVVVWQSDNVDGNGTGIIARHYTASGAQVGGDIIVNTTTAGDQTQPVVASLPLGQFVVAWSGPDANGTGVYFQRFASNNAPIAGEVLVNAGNQTGNQTNVDVSTRADGSFVVTWQDSGTGEIWAQRISNDGNFNGAPIRIDTEAGADYDAHVAALDNGGFAVTWTSDPGDVDGADIFVRIYDEDGVPLGGPIAVNDFTVGQQVQPEVVNLGNNDFVVVWSSQGNDGSGYGVYYQRFTYDGTKITGAQGAGETLVNTTISGDQTNPTVARLTDGGFAVTWQSFGQDGSQDGLFIQRYAPTDDIAGFNLIAKIGQEVQVNDQSAGNQRNATISALSAGDFLVAWESDNFDAGDIRIKRYDTPGEDEAVPLNISAGLGDLDGSEGLSVEIEISNVPGTARFVHDIAGNYVDVGTDLGGGVWRFTQAELVGLHILPPDDSNEPFTIVVTAYAIETSTPDNVAGDREIDSRDNIAWVTRELTIVNDPVADPPFITVASAEVDPLIGAEDQPLPMALPFDASLTDQDGSETLTIQISGVPVGSSIFIGPIEIPEAIDPITGAPQPGVYRVTFDPDAPQSFGRTQWGAGVNPGQDPEFYPLPTTGEYIVTDASPTNFTIAFVESNDPLVPPLGTFDSRPSNFYFQPPVDYSNVDLRLSVAAISTEIANGATDILTQTMYLNVAAVADAPDVDLVAAVGDEDTAIALSISVAVTDDSEVIDSIVISGVPVGASLNHGSTGGGGIWTLTEADLVGLTVTPPADSDVNFTLAVAVTSREPSNNDTETTFTNLDVVVNPVADTPTLQVSNVSGGQGEPIELSISTFSGEGDGLGTNDGSEFLQLVVLDAGIDLTGFEVNKGTLDEANGTWTMTGAEFNAGDPPAIVAPIGFTGTIQFDVEVTWAETENGDTATAQSQIDLTVTTAGLPGVIEMLDVRTNGDGWIFNGYANGISGGDRVGWSVANVGDVNGDGIDDVLIGAPGATVGTTFGAGEVYLVFGVTGGFVEPFDLHTLDGSNGLIIRNAGLNFDAAFGTSVSGLGDINGDNIDDFIIGAPGEDANGPFSFTGAAYIVYGRDADANPNGGAGGGETEFGASGGVLDLASMTSTTGVKIVNSNFGFGEQLGSAVSLLGDVSGDGIDDFLVGASGVGGATGEAYVIYGVSGGFGSATFDLSALDASSGLVFHAEQLAFGAEDHLGSALRSAGDFDGDGIGDMILGAYGLNSIFELPGAANWNKEGLAYVVFGQNGGYGGAGDLDLLESAGMGLVIRGSNPGDNFGWSVSGIGDFNGDGFDDIVIGAPGADPDGNSGAGSAYVIYGRSRAEWAARDFSIDVDTLTEDEGFVIQGTVVDSRLGVSVRDAGDVNGDGYADLIVGAPGIDTPADDDRVYVLFGTPNGFPSPFDPGLLDGTNGFLLNSAVGTAAGLSVSSAGDVDHDGFDDLLIGAPQGGANLNGQAYIVYGKSLLGAGSIVGTAGDDDIEGSAFSNTIVGGYGNDIIDGGGGNDRLYGGADNDIVLGAEGDDWIDGGAGNDTLLGEYGDDEIHGGAGSDILFGDGVNYFQNPESIDVPSWTRPGISVNSDAEVAPDGSSTADILTGTSFSSYMYHSFASLASGQKTMSMFFKAGSASGVAIGLDGGGMNTYIVADFVLGSITAVGGAPDGHGIEDVGNGWYRAWISDTSNGTGFSIVITIIPNAPGETIVAWGAQLVDGPLTDYVSVEQSGDDILFGDSGNDTIVGGHGNDLIEGGMGADSMMGQAGIDTLSYAGSAAAVTVNLTAGTATGGDATGDTFSSFENVRGSAHNDTLTGDANANVLEGGAGDDTLAGLAGADTLDGGQGFDTATYAASNAAVQVNLGAGTATGGHAQDDILVSIEQLIGSAFNDTLTGGAGSNTIEGGAGADTLNGDGGVNTLSYAGSTAGVIVNFTTSSVSGGHATGDVVAFATFQNILGSAFNDTLTGNAANNVIEGGAGNDVLDGAGGTDTVSYVSETAGVTVDLAAGSAAGGAGNDTLSNFENIIGSSHNDVLIGDAGANVIFGGAGNDVIRGGAGADTLDGGSGNNTVSYAGSTAVTVNLATGTLLGGHAAGDVITNFQNIIGSSFADTLTGDAGDNVIEGGAGADILFGGGGVDTLSYASSSGGVTANLELSIFTGADATGDIISSFENIIGSAFDDSLSGDFLGNTITGGAGNDTLSGGFGHDVFVYRLGDGNDTITDFTPGAASDDVLVLDGIPNGDYASLIAAAVDSGPDAILHLGDGSTITLQNVNKNQLHEDDFSFI